MQPTELLGVYCFCKRVPGGPGGGGGGGSSSERPRSGLPPRPSSSSGGGQSCYSTVSHFNLIHISCHAAARRADSALRQPKREWEGATRRNGDTLCNNLLPVASASVPLDAYTAAASIFWDNLAALGGGGGRSGGSRSTRRLLAPEEDACSQANHPCHARRTPTCPHVP